jgi:hypothetical protein
MYKIDRGGEAIFQRFLYFHGGSPVDLNPGDLGELIKGCRKKQLR